MTRVLVVDDSAVVRGIVESILADEPDLEVIASVGDAYAARDAFRATRPDVITLDVEMPGMNGLEFLKHLMTSHPTPVVMVSSKTQRGGRITLRALQLGAVDFVAKPATRQGAEFAAFRTELVRKIREAASARVRRLETTSPVAPVEAPARITPPSGMLIAIGASTGGTRAIAELLAHCAPPFPPVVVTQHIPKSFSAAFAAHVDEVSKLRCEEARAGVPLENDHVYVAPGDQHLMVRSIRGRLHTALTRAPEVNGHRPSVDVLFDSVRSSAGPAHTVAVLLTGMGTDGALALKRLRDAGARTLVQDESSSVVWGMPGEAWKIGAAEMVLPLNRIAPKLAELLAGRRAV